MIALTKGKMALKKGERMERGGKERKGERKYGSCKWRRMNGARAEDKKKCKSGVRMYKPEQIVITSL